jgi:hypothetical protein
MLRNQMPITIFDGNFFLANVADQRFFYARFFCDCMSFYLKIPFDQIIIPFYLLTVTLKTLLNTRSTNHTPVANFNVNSNPKHIEISFITPQVTIQLIAVKAITIKVVMIPANIFAFILIPQNP